MPISARSPERNAQTNIEIENQKITARLLAPDAIAKAEATCTPIRNGPRIARPGTP